MAKPNKRPTKGAPPQINAPQDASHNLQKPEAGELVPMNFKVSPEFKKEFKGFANDHDLTMVDLLKAAYELYKHQKGGV